MGIKQIIKEHFVWRNQIWILALTDIKKLYSGAALGWAWAAIKPALHIFIFWFAFSFGLRDRAGVEGIPFFFWLLAGMIPWFYIREMLNRGTNCMRSYKHLITKMKFPVSIIPTFVSVSEFLVHLGLMAATIVIYIAAGYTPTIYWIQLPLYMLGMFVFCTAWSMFGSVFAAMSKDFLNLVKSVTMALFWLSFVMFPYTNIGVGWISKLVMFNPITYTVEGYRNCFLHQKWFFEDSTWTLIYVCELAIMIILACLAFKKMKKELPDVL